MKQRGTVRWDSQETTRWDSQGHPEDSQRQRLRESETVRCDRQRQRVRDSQVRLSETARDRGTETTRCDRQSGETARDSQVWQTESEIVRWDRERQSVVVPALSSRLVVPCVVLWSPVLWSPVLSSPVLWSPVLWPLSCCLVTPRVVAPCVTLTLSSAVPDHVGASGVRRLHGEERPLQEVQAWCLRPHQHQTLVSSPDANVNVREKTNLFNWNWFRVCF